MSIYSWQSALWEKLLQSKARLPHALLLRGQEGIGKLDFAMALTHALLCKSPLANGQACGTCSSCIWLSQSHHPDFRLLSPEFESDNGEDAPVAVASSKKTQISVAQIRELSTFLELSSHQSEGRRIVLVHPAEALNLASANALLKILEEPPAGVIFFLVSHQPQRLLPTILSRCQKIDMPVPQPETATAWLAEQGVKDPSRHLAYSGGSPLLALRNAGEGVGAMDEICKSLSHGPRMDPFATASLCAKQGMGIAVQALQKWVYDLANLQLTGEVRYYEPYRNALQALAKSADLSLLFDYQRKLDQAKKTATHPLNSELQLENLLLQYTQIFPISQRLR
ncbi:MAG TPA: DNA polymerase III subunit delta' [Methylophilaceae bacterium]|nr:DNA polymerase III subunit delta' [Methylophilaceae bacterium]